jgi:hypothetical protein
LGITIPAVNLAASVRDEFGKAVAVLRSKYEEPGTAKLQAIAPDKGINSEIELKLSGHSLQR